MRNHPYLSSVKTETISGVSSAPIRSVIDRCTALMKAQRQSFADLYIAAQRRCLYDEKAVRSSGNRDMRFILSNSPAGNRTRLRRCALGDGHFSNGGSRRAHVCFGHFRYLITAS